MSPEPNYDASWVRIRATTLFCLVSSQVYENAHHKRGKAASV